MAIQELTMDEVAVVSGGVVKIIAGFVAGYVAGKAVDGLISAAGNGGTSGGGGQLSDISAP